MNIRIILLFLLMLSHSSLLSQAQYKTHLNLDIENPLRTCATTNDHPDIPIDEARYKLFDSNTAVTFFGDSRIDLVDIPLYGASSLDFYLHTLGEWNTQNFGVSGMNSSELKDQIQTCFRRDPNDVTKPAYPNFKIA